MQYLKISLISIFIISSVKFLLGQEFTVSIEQTVKKLPPEKWIELNEVPQKIQSYIENYQWTDGDIPLTIELNIQILYENVRSSYEEIYSARISFMTSTNFKYSDIHWKFPYLRSDNLDHTNIFDPLTGLLDYYLNIILGDELDRYSEFGGDPYFNKAVDIALQGKLARSPYATWWDRRERYARSFLSKSHRYYRQLRFYFYVADYYYDEKNNEEVKAAIDLIVNNLRELSKYQEEEEYVEKFFNRNYMRLAEVFKLKKDMLDVLIEIDPDHKDIYQKSKT